MLSFKLYLIESTKRKMDATAMPVSKLKSLMDSDTYGFRGGIEIECLFPVKKEVWVDKVINSRYSTKLTDVIRIPSIPGMSVGHIMVNEDIIQLFKKHNKTKIDLELIYVFLNDYISSKEFIKDKKYKSIAGLLKNKKDFPSEKVLFQFLVYYLIYQQVIHLDAKSFHKLIKRNDDLLELSFNLVNDRMKDLFDIDAKVSIHHGHSDYSRWGITYDSSVFNIDQKNIPDYFLVPVEIVSPIMKTSEMMTIPSIMDKLHASGCITNKSTGLHFSFSAEHMNSAEKSQINWLVFMFRFFEAGVLKRFGRLNNVMTKSILRFFNHQRKGTYDEHGNYIQHGLHPGKNVNHLPKKFNDWNKDLKSRIEYENKPIDDKESESKEMFDKAIKDFSAEKQTDWKSLVAPMKAFLSSNYRPWEDLDNDGTIEIDRYFTINFEHFEEENWRIEIRAMGGDYISKGHETLLHIMRIYEALNFAMTPLDMLLSYDDNVYLLHRQMIRTANILEPTQDSIGVSKKLNPKSTYVKNIKYFYTMIDKTVHHPFISNVEAKEMLKHLGKQMNKYKFKFMANSDKDLIYDFRKFLPSSKNFAPGIIKSTIDSFIRDNHGLSDNDKMELEKLKINLIELARQLENSWVDENHSKKDI